ncbi:MAG TPA: Ig-like domain-containing protein [Thermoplasmata archaeon]|nr:Ig-like domain-containing protein [Thermoplasmata archaeon]
MTMKSAAFLSIAVLVTVLAPGVVHSATVSYPLFGRISPLPSGWGSTSGSETNPGPTLNATQGDTVQLTLNSDDTTHSWFLDYNNDQFANVGEPASSTFSFGSPAFFQFTANVPGIFTYRCGIHTTTMTGQFQIGLLGNQPPTATLTAPSGAQDWTGGTPHGIVWTMDDPDGPLATLQAWLNYTSSAGNGAIAGPILGSANPHSFAWTVPFLNAADVTVHLDVVDQNGTGASDQALVPLVDSRVPTITAVSPANNSAGVPVDTNVTLTFDEPMNIPATTSAVTLGSASGAVAFTTSWVAENLTLNPSALLSPNTTYWANVSSAASDASDPGNPLAFTSFRFTTAPDTNPPTAVITPPAQFPVGVNLTFLGTASSDAEGLIASYSWELTNASGVLASGTVATFTHNFPDTGTYNLTLNVTDLAGNQDEATLTFDVLSGLDITPPVIAPSVSATAPVLQSISGTVTITDAVGVTIANLTYVDVRGAATTVVLDPGTGDIHSFTIPAQLAAGTVTITFATRDAAGNAATETATVTITGAPASPALYGTAAGGWGFGPGNLSTPGPTVEVTAGQSITLLGWDNLPHFFYVDVNGNGAPDAGEPTSAEFQGNFTVLPLTGLAAGNYTYYCGIHPGTMHGTLRVAVGGGGGPGPAPPWVLLALLVLVLLVVLAFVLLLRRRSKPEPPAEPPPEPASP